LRRYNAAGAKLRERRVGAQRGSIGSRRGSLDNQVNFKADDASSSRV
jgi:hypothetical protein